MSNDERKVLIGKTYRHFKGMTVLTIALPINTETSEKMVMYKCLSDGEYYVRPCDMFLSEVDHDKYPNVTQKYRFEEISAEEAVFNTMIPDDVRVIMNVLKGV